MLSDNDRWRAGSVNLNASENVLSPAARSVLDSDLLLSEEVFLALGDDPIRNCFAFLRTCYIRGQGDRKVFGYVPPPGQ